MNSVLLAALISSGASTASLPSAFREALVAAGAADGKLSTYLTAQGYTGSVADMLMKHLGNLGYVGTLSDRLRAGAAGGYSFITANTLVDSYSVWLIDNSNFLTQD